MQTNNVVLERYGVYDEERDILICNHCKEFHFAPKDKCDLCECQTLSLTHKSNGQFVKERIIELIDKNIDNMKGFQKCIQGINIESKLREIKPNCLLSIAIVNNLGKYPLETIIGNIKDFAKDNYQMTEKIIGKDLLKTIINF